MNILFVFGNGLDINLGLKNSYQDFYDYYLDRPSSSPLIEKLKDHLKKERYGQWSDLELGLGRYTEEVDSVEDLEVIYHDLDDNLQSYLKVSVTSFSIDDSLRNNFIRDLNTSYRGLPGVASQEVNYYLSQIPNHNINIMTFNYTNVVEKILYFKIPNKTFPLSISQFSSVNSVQHIHMTLNHSDIIMGVNDESQIKNNTLICSECKGLMIKPYINQRLGMRVDSECMYNINNADYICLFGLSLGETDNIWWKAIGERMRTSSARLVLYYYDKDIITYNNRLILKMDYCRDLLMRRMDIKNMPSDLPNRIYIGYKADIFSGK
jgi:hypothetical protein